MFPILSCITFLFAQTIILIYLYPNHPSYFTNNRNSKNTDNILIYVILYKKLYLVQTIISKFSRYIQKKSNCNKKSSSPYKKSTIILTVDHIAKNRHIVTQTFLNQKARHARLKPPRLREQPGHNSARVRVRKLGDREPRKGFSRIFSLH